MEIKKKEKVAYKRYNARLKGREYDILVPNRSPKETYVYPDIDTCIETPNLDGDHVLYNLLRSICVELIRDPGVIVYVPSRRNGSMHEDRIGNELSNYDVVFCCHNSQLNRHKWGRIKKCFPFLKATQYISVYDVDSCKEYCKKEVRIYEKSSDYYVKKSDWRIHECSLTYFSKGSVPLYCESFLTICEFIEGLNLKMDVMDEGFSPFCFAFGFEMGYLSREIVDYWDVHKLGCKSY